MTNETKLADHLLTNSAQGVGDAGKPVRVQLSRKKGWRKPENTVVVARPSKWGNPYGVGPKPPITVRSVEYAVECFRNLVVKHGWNLTPLRGKNLACWCPLDQPCHADVLLELASRSLPTGGDDGTV